MCLSKADSADDEKRIVGVSGVLTDRDSTTVGKFIVLTNNIVLKRVIRVELGVRLSRSCLGWFRKIYGIL